MIASWFVSCALWSVLMSAAAWLIERLLLKSRLPVRGVWIGAICISIVGPALSQGPDSPLASLARTTGRLAAEIMGQPANSRLVPLGSMTHRIFFAAPVAAGGDNGRALPVDSTPGFVSRSFNNAYSVLVAHDRALSVAWLLLSLAMMIYVAGGVVRLRLIRRSWRQAIIYRTPVLVSADTGPAAIGVWRATVVLPERLLDLEPAKLMIVLQHESQHIAARDPRVLALAQAAIVAAPWNAMLWWMARRLNTAVELDCDARVVRELPDLRAYGELLIEIGASRREFGFAMAAMSGAANQLARRIRVLSNRASLGRTVAIGGGVGGSVIALLAACSLPPLTRTPAPASAATAASSLRTDTSARKVTLDTADAPSDDTRKTREAIAARDSLRTRQPTTNGQAVGRGHAWTIGVDTAASRSMASSAAVSEYHVDLDEPKRVDATPTAPRTWDIQPPTHSSAAAPSSGIRLGCGASVVTRDSSVYTLLIRDADAMVAGRAEISSEATSPDGARAEFFGEGAALTSQVCSVTRTGEIRISGNGLLDGSRIRVKTTVPATLVVRSESGRLLAGPVRIENEANHYTLEWTASRL